MVDNNYDFWESCIAEVDEPGYWDGDSIKCCDNCDAEIEKGERYIATDGQEIICIGCATETVESDIRELYDVLSEFELPTGFPNLP